VTDIGDEIAAVFVATSVVVPPIVIRVPFGSDVGRVAVVLQLPPTKTVADLLITAPPPVILTETVAPGSPVPEIVKVEPPTTVDPAVGEVMMVAGEIAVSFVTKTGVEAPVLPAALVADAVIVKTPSPNVETFKTKLQVRAGATTTEGETTDLPVESTILTNTVLPLSALPLTVKLEARDKETRKELLGLKMAT